jgi:putative aldouronate transport system permease protein
MAKNQKNTRLNTVSTGTEAIIHIMIGLFSLCCIIPFIFVIIIAFSSEQSIREIGYSFWPTQWSTESCPRSGGPSSTVCLSP